MTYLAHSPQIIYKERNHFTASSSVKWFLHMLPRPFRLAIYSSPLWWRSSSVRQVIARAELPLNNNGSGVNAGWLSIVMDNTNQARPAAHFYVVLKPKWILQDWSTLVQTLVRPLPKIVRGDMWLSVTDWKLLMKEICVTQLCFLTWLVITLLFEHKYYDVPPSLSILVCWATFL